MRRERSLAILVLVVAFAAASVVVVLNNLAREGSRAVNVLTTIDSLVNQQTALEFETIAAQSPVLADPPAKLRALREQIDRSFEELRRSPVEAAAVDAVALAYERYSAILDEEFALLAVGRIAEARRRNADLGNSAFLELHDEIRRVARATDELARSRGVVADVGSIAVMLLAATALTALIGRLANARMHLATIEEQELRQSGARTRSLVQNSSDVITVILRDLTIQSQSASLSRVFGFGPDELLGTPIADWIHPDDREPIVALLAETMRQPSANMLFECRVRHADGSWRDAQTALAVLLHDPNVRGAVLNTRDTTERKALERQLAFQAFYDPLTKLANRALFQEHLEKALSRRQHGTVAVMFLDLDGFKLVNDGFGHDVGDLLLSRVAERLRGATRDEDTVARFGGDEFSILLHVEDATAARGAAHRILAALEAPFSLGGHEYQARASVGVALADPGVESADVLRNADAAMYVAKVQGKNRVELFHPMMRAASIRRLAFEAECAGALERDEFELHYQPLVDLDRFAVSGFEALVRWRHPARGLLSPQHFIALAEETGQIRELGGWILGEACRQLRAWQLGGGDAAWPQMSINLSAKQFQDPQLIDRVRVALESSGVAPDTVTLELTESAVIVDPSSAAARMDDLKGLGVRIAIDDFGTGYSSLAYLQRFPVDVLKIDKLFVDQLPGTSARGSLVDVIVDLGHRLQLETVAEGVEREDQVAGLQRAGCDLAQGFYFSKPLPADDAWAAIDPASRGLLPEQRLLVAG